MRRELYPSHTDGLLSLIMYGRKCVIHETRGGQCEIIREEENMTAQRNIESKGGTHKKRTCRGMRHPPEPNYPVEKLPYLFRTEEEGKGELHKLNVGLKKSLLSRRGAI